jgi:hypothetical protein
LEPTRGPRLEGVPAASNRNPKPDRTPPLPDRTTRTVQRRRQTRTVGESSLRTSTQGLSDDCSGDEPLGELSGFWFGPSDHQFASSTAWATLDHARKMRGTRVVLLALQAPAARTLHTVLATVYALVADARRHGVTVREPDINVSLADATLETDADSIGGVALRLGLAGVRHLGDAVAEQIVAERLVQGPYASIGDLTRCVQLKRSAAEALATAGAFAELGGDRCQDLWAAGAAATTRPGHLPRTRTRPWTPRPCRG